MRPEKKKSRWEGGASLQNPLQLGHLFSEHRHTRVAHRALFFFRLRSRQIDTWSTVRTYVSHLRKKWCF